MKKRVWLLLGLVLVTGCLCGGFLLAQSKNSVSELKIQPNSDGTTTVFFQSAAGKTYHVESSDNMATWGVVSPNLSSTGSITEWVDTRSASEGKRFYRVSVATAAARPPVLNG